MNPLKVLDALGQGTYGTVYRVQDRITHKDMALKRISVPPGNAVADLLVQRELENLTACQHPNVVLILNAWREAEALSTGEQRHYHYYILMELCQDSLRGVLRDNDYEGLEVDRIRSITAQMIRGLDYVHSKGIIHRDLKPDNILIAQDGTVKLADFGMSRVESAERVYTPNHVTLYYRSPEILLGATRYSSAADLWSLGCVIAELFLGEPLMCGSSETSQLLKIVELFGPVSRSTMPRDLDLPVLESVAFTGNISVDAWRRVAPSFTRDHEGSYLIMSLLSVNPDRRMSCAAALSHTFIASCVADASSPAPNNIAGVQYQRDAHAPSVSIVPGHQVVGDGSATPSSSQEFSEGFPGAPASSREQSDESSDVSQRPQQVQDNSSSGTSSTSRQQPENFLGIPVHDDERSDDCSEAVISDPQESDNCSAGSASHQQQPDNFLGVSSAQDKAVVFMPDQRTMPVLCSSGSSCSQQPPGNSRQASVSIEPFHGVCDEASPNSLEVIVIDDEDDDGVFVDQHLPAASPENTYSSSPPASLLEQGASTQPAANLHCASPRDSCQEQFDEASLNSEEVIVVDEDDENSEEVIVVDEEDENSEEVIGVDEEDENSEEVIIIGDDDEDDNVEMSARVTVHHMDGDASLEALNSH